MKERPISFNAPMVRAILDGTKTQTRRLVKPQPHIDPQGNFCWDGRNYGQDFNGPHIQAIASPIPSSRTKRVLCPYGKPGDRVWVREAWSICEEYDYLRISEMDYRHKRDLIYAADGVCTTKKRPSIHMPRWASRITLEITSVRVERLQDISEADAIAEGVTKIRDACHVIRGFGYDLYGLCHTSAITPYAQLWESINGPGSWDANAWVWVVEFKRVMP